MSKHRVRARPRVKGPPAEPEDQTLLDLAELVVLWPRLDAALARDAAGPSAAPTGSTSAVGRGSAAVLNLDVQHVLVEIATGVRQVEAQVQRILNLAPARRSTGQVLEATAAWYVQLRVRGQPLARHIADDVASWLRSARSVLRLRTRAEPIGWLCPHHRDRPAELRRDPDEAVLAPAILAGKQPLAGHAPLTWRRAEAVHCPRCRKRWAGVAELRVLMRMIQQLEAGA